MIMQGYLYAIPLPICITRMIISGDIGILFAAQYRQYSMPMAWDSVGGILARDLFR